MIDLFMTTEADEYLATNIFRNYQFKANNSNSDITESAMLEELYTLDYSFTD